MNSFDAFYGFIVLFLSILTSSFILVTKVNFSKASEHLAYGDFRPKSTGHMTIHVKCRLNALILIKDYYPRTSFIL